MLARIIALVVKELRTVLRDPRSRFVLIGPPIIQLLVFGYAATFDLEHIPFGVRNADGGAYARALVARLAGSPAFELVEELRSEEEVREAIDARRVLLVLAFDPDFTRALEAGRPAPLQVVIDGRNSNTALIALGYVRSIVDGFSREVAPPGGRSPAPIEPRAWFNPNLESQWFVVPGIVGLLGLVVTLVVTALSIAREREAGTFDQLLVTPLRPFEILLGKALPGILIGTVEATFIVAMTVLWFEVPLRGSLVLLYTGIWLFLLSAVGVGLMISSFAVTQQQGLLGAFLFLVPAVILSGFATPIENMPHLIQWLTLANPMRYFLVVIRSLYLEGAGWDVLAGELWPMAAIGLTALVVAAWFFRRRLY